MTTEVLAVPEDKLLEVVTILRIGMEEYADDPYDRRVSDNTMEHLAVWCDEIEDYVKEQNEERWEKWDAFTSGETKEQATERRKANARYKRW